MDGTLLDLHFDNHFWQHHLPERMAAMQSAPLAQTREALEHRFAREQGTLNWYCVDFWSRELGVDIRSMKDEIAHLIAIRPHVEEFLRRLKASHRRTLVITNAHQLSLELKCARTGLADWVDEVVVSHRYGAPKESPRFWEALQAEHPFNPERTLFIDDTASILEAAHRAGIRHLLTLRQPDSRRPAREGLVFPAILHFDEIMPVLDDLS